MQARLQHKAKLNTQSICVCRMVYVVFRVWAHSSECCTCGQTSVRHITGVTRHVTGMTRHVTGVTRHVTGATRHASSV